MTGLDSANSAALSASSRAFSASSAAPLANIVITAFGILIVQEVTR